VACADRVPRGAQLARAGSQYRHTVDACGRPSHACVTAGSSARDEVIRNSPIVSKLWREHRTTFDDLKGVERRQIVAMQMPATPDQHRFNP
jgi:hypothetical protein